jgi:hypothetical protein
MWIKHIASIKTDFPSLPLKLHEMRLLWNLLEDIRHLYVLPEGRVFQDWRYVRVWLRVL